MTAAKKGIRVAEYTQRVGSRVALPERLSVRYGRVGSKGYSLGTAQIRLDTNQ
jgi:hypothetical protein